MKQNFKKKILENGLTLLFEKRNVPVVSCILATKVGGIHEDLNEKGISHFIEHLLSKGTKNMTPKQIAEAFEKNGGEMNGFTSDEITGFYCKMPSNKLRVALEVLSDMVKNPLFDEKEIEKERKVIFEEVKLYKDNPKMHIFNEIKKCLYGGTLSIDLIGTEKILNSLGKKELVERFKKTYFSENLILCVVGDANFEEVVKFAEENFVKKKGNLNVKEITLKNEIKIEKRKAIDQANLVFAYHSPLPNEKDYFASEILMALMAGGMSSRLFEEIREKRNLAYSIKGDIDSNKNFCYSFIYVGTMKENVELVKKLILKEFEKVSKELSEKELNEIKIQLIGQHNISMEDSQVQMVNLLSNEIHTKAEDFYDFEENIKNVKLDDVKKLASKVKEGIYSFFALVPED